MTRRIEWIAYALFALFLILAPKDAHYPDRYSWSTGYTYADRPAIAKYGSWVTRDYISEDEICLWARREYPFKWVWTNNP